MSESYTDTLALQKLAKSFSTYGEDLASYVSDFEKKTGAEVIHDGFGVLTESEEVTSAYIELSEGIADALEALRRHLDGLSDGIKTVKDSSTATDTELAEQLFSSGGKQ